MKNSFFISVQCIEHAGFFFEHDVYTHLYPPTGTTSEKTKSIKSVLHLKQKIICKKPYFLQKIFTVSHKGKIPTVEIFFLLGERNLSLWLPILVNYFVPYFFQSGILNIRF